MKRSYWLYGLLMGVLLVVLQVLEYRTRVYDLRIEVFGVLIGVLFLVLGVWLGQSRKAKSATVPTSQEPPATPQRSAPEDFGISPREYDVLVLLVEGLSNQEIADRMFVSPNTVKTHLSNLYQKLEVQRRGQAIRKATDLGLVLSGEMAKSPERVKE